MEYRFPSPFFFFSITPEEAGFVPVSEEVEQRVGMGASLFTELLCLLSLGLPPIGRRCPQFFDACWTDEGSLICCEPSLSELVPAPRFTPVNSL